MPLPAPDTLEQVLSPAWLSAALSTAARPVEVVAVREVQNLKTMARKVRFEVDYREGADDPIRNFCVKGFFDNDSPPNTEKFSATEARYYQELKPGSGVRTPACRYAGHNPNNGHGLILMEDVVAAGGRFLTALEPYSPTQAEASLDQLALLHAEHWGAAALDKFSWLSCRLNELARNPRIPNELLQELLDGPRGDPLTPEIRNAERLHRGIQALSKADADKPQCLVHGDAHAGNIFELDGKASLIDWQLLQRANWALDVAYHIGSTLTVEALEESEQPLLRHYLARLAQYGGAAPAWDEAWAAYRSHLVYAYYLWGITRRVDPPIIVEFVKRLGLAVTRHRSFELLDV